MTALANKYSKIMALCNTPTPKPTEKRFIEYCQETIKDGKYSIKGILKLAWREIKQGRMKFGQALKYAWGIAKNQMESLQRNQNLDLRSMGFTRID